MKGNADCHIPHNRERYDWIKTKSGKCKYRRDIGSRSICMINQAVLCPQKWVEVPNCPINKYQE